MVLSWTLLSFVYRIRNEFAAIGMDQLFVTIPSPETSILTFSPHESSYDYLLLWKLFYIVVFALLINVPRFINKHAFGFLT